MPRDIRKVIPSKTDGTAADIATETGQGTDGATPPPTGTGVRGWLRNIYEALTGLALAITGGKTLSDIFTRLGDGSANVKLRNSAGAIIDPATSQGVASVVTALGSPAQVGEAAAAAAALAAVTALETTQKDVKRSVTDFRTILDYDGRTDGNAVYVGKNLQTVAVAAATWAIAKLFYDASGNLLDVQILIGAWTGRAALAWKAPGGD